MQNNLNVINYKQYTASAGRWVYTKNENVMSIFKVVVILMLFSYGGLHSQEMKFDYGKSEKYKLVAKWVFVDNVYKLMLHNEGVLDCLIRMDTIQGPRINLQGILRDPSLTGYAKDEIIDLTPSSRMSKSVKNNPLGYFMYLKSKKKWEGAVGIEIKTLTNYILLDDSLLTQGDYATFDQVREVTGGDFLICIVHEMSEIFLDQIKVKVPPLLVKKGVKGTSPR